MKAKRNSFPFRLIRSTVKFFYKKIEVVGEGDLPARECIIVGNHSKMNGPLVSELYLNSDTYTWCTAEMMNVNEVPSYAYRDFWSGKPKALRPFYKGLSYAIALPAAYIFRRAKTIPVYHDQRIVSTFKMTVNELEKGKRVVIFPEHSVPYNDIVCKFQNRFVDVSRLYKRRTGKELIFVPMYIAPNLRRAYFGDPVAYSSDNSPELERERICAYLMEEITRIARSLPEHTVVPYENIPRRKYPSNVSKEK